MILAASERIILDICCRPYNLFTNTCRKEWDEAVANTACSAVGAWRMWPHTFGPYFDPNTGDQMSFKCTIWGRVNPKYEYVCVTGRCIPDTKKKPKDKEKPKLIGTLVDGTDL